MNALQYHPLCGEQISTLLAPENADLERAWDSLTGALHGLIAIWSTTHPRPLYFYEELDRRDLVEQPARLLGTEFYEIALHNVRAAEEVERIASERGDTPEVREIVDQYVDAILDEFDAIRQFPEIPRSRSADEENGMADRHRAVAGR